MLGSRKIDYNLNHVTQAEINLNDLPSGIYFIRLYTEGGIFTQKLNIVK